MRKKRFIVNFVKNNCMSSKSCDCKIEKKPRIFDLPIDRRFWAFVISYLKVDKIVWSTKRGSCSEKIQRPSKNRSEWSSYSEKIQSRSKNKSE